MPGGTIYMPNLSDLNVSGDRPKSLYIVNSLKQVVEKKVSLFYSNKKSDFFTKRIGRL